MTNRRKLDLSLSDTQFKGIPSPVVSALQDRFKRIAEVLEAGAGKRGKVNFASSLKLEDKRLKSLADAVADTDLITYGQLKKMLACKNLADILDECFEHEELIDHELDDPPAATPFTGGDWIFAYSVEMPEAALQNSSISAANKILACEFFLPWDFQVKKLVTSIENTIGTNLFSLGIYDVNLNLVCQTGALGNPGTAGVVIKSVTLGSTVSMPSGTYWLATTGTTAAYNITTIVADSPQQTILKQNETRIGEAANSSSGGILPSTLSTPFTAVAFKNIPILLLEGP